MTLIILDAGHGGNDPGATANNLIEKQLTLNLTLRVQQKLICREGFDVRLTRASDTFIGLSERADFANQLDADFFVSLHHNAGGGTGFESYVYPGTQDGETGRKQTIVHETVINFLSTFELRDRGKKEANFAVIRETTMSALLLENLFLDSNYDASLLKDPVFLDGLSDAIAKGIANVSL